MTRLPAQTKTEAVKLVVDSKEEVAKVAKEYGVARKTLYSWIKRYKERKKGSVDTLKPRYAKGKEHPRAKYPQIEKKLLKLSAKNPEMPMEELAKKIEVSVWTVWSLLDKHGLNTTQKRIREASRLLVDLSRLSAKKKREAVFKIIHENEKVAQVSKEYGIARKTLYSWIKRYQQSYDNSLKTFKPRYITGEDHHNAKYPQIEEQLLTLVANNPELSMNALAKKVPVSVWAVWNLLNKYDLNTKKQRFEFAFELIKRRDAVLPALTPEMSFAYIAKRVELLLSLTRKIPKYSYSQFISKLQDITSAISIQLAVFSVSISTLLRFLLWLFINPPLSLLTSLRLHTEKFASDIEFFLYQITRYVLLIPKNVYLDILLTLVSIKALILTSPQNLFNFTITFPARATNSLANLLQTSYYSIRNISLALIISRLRLSFSALSFDLKIELSQSSESALQQIEKAADELYNFILRFFGYLRISPRYSLYYASLILFMILTANITGTPELASTQDTTKTKRATSLIEDTSRENEFKISDGKIVLAGNMSFDTQETPSFTVQKQVSAFERAGSSVGRVLGVQNQTLKALDPIVTDKNGDQIQGVAVIQNGQGGYDINVERSELKPGKYNISIKDVDGTQIVQEFGWGMVAINTDRSSYKPGDKVKISITTLGDQGKPVCDAKIVMSITNANMNSQQVLITDDKGIKVSTQCGSGQKTIDPDLSAEFVVDRPGEHIVRLAAVVGEERYLSISTFNVTTKETVQDFEVGRAAPIRVVAGEEYPVLIQIKANRDYKGQVIDRLPKSFLAKPYSSDVIELSGQAADHNTFVTKNSEDHQALIWDVDLKKGETYVLKYSFSDLGSNWSDYYLGPVFIDNNNVHERWDLRQDLDAKPGKLIARERFGSLRAEDRVLQMREGSMQVSMQKAHFEIQETPVVFIENIDVQEQTGVFQRLLAISNENLNRQEGDGTLSITVENIKGVIEFEAVIDAKDANIQIPKEDLKPGKHIVTIRDNETGNYVEQSFLYGVLALNLNKSKYLMDETAYIQIASLDERGNTQCSSNLELTVFSPDGGAETFRVEDQTISQSENCGINNVTDDPDYFVYLPLSSVGEYRLMLTNLENGFLLEETFSVEQELDLEFERIGATRINPFRSTYVMRLLLTSGSDISGSLMERIPLDFEIANSEGLNISVEDNYKLLTWLADLEAGVQTGFEYEYQAPKVSPELYLLGPAQFMVGGSTIFAESRQWQLASDAQFARPSSDVSTGNWTTTPLYQKIDEAVANDADSVRSGNNPSNDAFEVGLSAVDEPEFSTGHIVRVRERMQQTGGGSHATSTVVVALKQGATTIASQTYTHGGNDLAWYDRSFTLTTTQADLITDYTNLGINISASKTGGTRTGWIEVSWAEFEVPDPPPNQPPTLTIAQPDGIDDEIAQNANFTVVYSLSDPDNTVTANFYYDTNNTGLDGTAIAGCQNQAEGTNATCTWNTTGVAPGTYYVYGITNDGFNPEVSTYSSGVVTINAAPTISIAQPDGIDDMIVQDGNFTVQYSLADTDNTVTANFYYDNNNTGLDGTAMAGCQNQIEGTNLTCTWNTTGVTPGTYYVYGITNDGVNPQVSTYSSGVVTINAAPTLTISQPDGVGDEIAKDANFTVQYSLADTDNTVTANFYYDNNNTGLDGVAIAGCQNQAEGTNATCTWNTTGVAPGTYYVYGITNDGFNPEVSTYSSGVVTINAAPSISIKQPDGVDDEVTAGDNYTVVYDLADTDNTVTANFYYDNNNTGLDGVAIAGCQNQIEGTDLTCTWNTTGVDPGTYYVYGITNDGINSEISAYSSGVLIVNTAPETFTYFITGGTSWEVPSDWNKNDNSVEIIGAGGGGSNGAAGSGGAGGGGGGYSIANNLSLTPGSNVDVLLGTGGTVGNPGGSTYFNGTSCGASSVCATGGSAASGTTGGGGGSASVGAGFSGGTGGGGGAAANGGGGGGGGAGAAGPNAAGNNGTVGNAASGNTGGSGGGGGQGDGTSGGAGGTGGTTAGGTGGNGGNGTEWNIDHGSGGGAGGGGGADRNGGAGSAGTSGVYGAGGGGGGGGATGGTGPANGSSGRNGLIVVTYTTTGNIPPNLNITKPDGVNDTIAENANYTVQYDLIDPDDVVTADFYYDTDNTGFDGTAIAGCQNRPEGTGQTCIWDTTGIGPGDYYVYGIADDGINYQVSVYSTGPVTINGAPSVTGVALNGGSNINLTANTTTGTSFTATVTDPNGYQDISGVVGKMYRSGVSLAEGCTVNNNNCYADISCSLSGCSGNSCTATCTVNVAFFADATDAGTYLAEYWLAWVQVADSQSVTGQGFSSIETTDMNSLLTISTAADIAYSTVNAGGVSDMKTTTVTNTGNRSIDLRLSGDNMCTDHPTCAGDQIAVGSQEYSSSSFSYGAGTALSSSLVTLGMGIAKSSVFPSNSAGEVYWLIGIPFNTKPGSYTGNNTIVSIVSE